MKTEDIETILEQHNGHRGGLISILQDIQARYSYLPADALRTVASKTGRSLVDIYGVATFYRAFSLKPRGKHLISVCLGTACHVRGGPTVAEAFEHELGVDSREYYLRQRVYSGNGQLLGSLCAGTDCCR